MSASRKGIKNYDLGFTAVCFACFLGIFTLGTHQTPETLSATECFAFSIPVLIASNMLLSIFNLDNEPSSPLKVKTAYLALGCATLGGMIGGLAGISFMFSSISKSSGHLFVATCLGCIFLIFVGMLIYESMGPSLAGNDVPVPGIDEVSTDGPQDEERNS